MKKTFNLLKKHNVTEYELIGWLTNALEEEVYADDESEDNKRREKLLEEVNALSWRV